MDSVPLGRLHIRPFQWYLCEFWDPAPRWWEANIPVLPWLPPHLQCRLQDENLLKGSLLDPLAPIMTLCTNVPLTGSGAFLKGKTALGLCSGLQLEEFINLLNMRAAMLFALKEFQSRIQCQHLFVATDNTTAVAYLQNQG